jgi:hypothetical protein
MKYIAHNKHKEGGKARSNSTCCQYNICDLQDIFIIMHRTSYELVFQSSRAYHLV